MQISHKFARAFILSSILVLSVSVAVKKSNLNQDWQLKIISCPSEGAKFAGKTFKTSVPTVLHLDLLFEKLIPDPFYEKNSEQVQWVSNCQVAYSKKFDVDEETQKAYANQKIVFEGIDTYATVSLNGEEILKTENAFRKYQLNLKPEQLKIWNNVIEVHIIPATEKDAEGQRLNSMPVKYAQTRKACYQYGWDWAPTLVTMGIWKSVYLEFFNDAKIDYVWVRNRMVSNEKAILNFAVALEVLNKTAFKSQNYEIQVEHAGKVLTKFKANDKNVYGDVQIENPRLWWPNGIGEPYVYDFKVKISKGQETFDTKEVVYGIRYVKLDLSNRNFTVSINGHSIYCKGANYVPADMFYPRLVNPRYTPANNFEQLTDDMVSSHFNMIRLWGGGQYQSDEFLELCSRKGIMIFYDFMFSDSIYPSTLEFLQNTEQEIKQQIRRARNYPALALWSGNNQILQGIYSWGWGRENYRNDYKKVFETLIPKVIEYESPYIPYIPSSPIYGVGNSGFEKGGDIHYWGVWAGGANFQNYESALGPFNSEFGTQATPVWESIKQFTGQGNRGYDKAEFRIHEKHNSGFNTLRRYISTYGKQSLNFELEAYQSGLVQAYAIEVAFKAQRCSKPKSYGTLYWQLNDAWPAISWSSIDYYGRWKPLQYMAKRMYPDVAVMFFKNKIYAISDKLNAVEAIAVIKCMDFEGNSIIDEKMTVKL